MNPKAYYWLDIETTGLDPQEDTILEIGLARATFDNPHAIAIIANEVLYFRDWSRVSARVIDMHATSGLMRDAMHSKMFLTRPDDDDDGPNPPESQIIEKVLLTRLDGFADDWLPHDPARDPRAMGDEEKPVLAGSSVHFDRNFLRVHMPKLSRLFSHRYLDVSALKLYCRSMGMAIQQKKEAHRVIDDIKESVRHSQECFEWLRDQTVAIEQFAKGKRAVDLPF